MLPVGNKSLLEEKTISYVTSAREIIRLDPAQSKSKSGPEKQKFFVMGSPDFDLDLAKTTPASSPVHLAGVATGLRSVSRDYHGLKFKPLPGAEAEARSVAKLAFFEAERASAWAPPVLPIVPSRILRISRPK